MVVESSWYTSSPKDAVVIEASIDGVGVVKVSLRNSLAAGDAFGLNMSAAGSDSTSLVGFYAFD